MNIQEQVVGIVKRYFDNAVIIDDELEFEQQSLLEINDEELDYIPDDFDVISDVAPTSMREQITANEKPGELFQELTKEGIVTFPYKYQRTADEIQLRWLSSILRNTKLLFLDWNLEEAKSGTVSVAGTASMKILEEYSKVRPGLKCAVIYTQASCTEVLEEISTHFDIVDNNTFFFQERNIEDGNSLFGFVMNKELQPSSIMNIMGSILLKDKSISLHILDSVYRLEQSISNVMYRFNAPFEKVIFTQMISSKIDNNDIPAFLDDTLLSDVLTEHSKISATNFLFQSKKSEILQTLLQKPIEQSEIEFFHSIIALKKKNLVEIKLLDHAFMCAIIDLLRNDEIDSLASFKDGIVRITANQMSEEHIQEAMLVLMLLDAFRKNPKDFRETFQKQTYYLTKLMKYYNTTPFQIDTGSIWNVVGEEGQFMLCITPFCDTCHPEKVDHTYKFIIGKATSPTDKLLNNNDIKSAFISVPIEETKSLIFVKWDFYNVLSMDKVTALQKLHKITTLKKEYVQNIINRYIGYQARAGVNELFYKDSYRNNFVSLLS